MSDVSACAAKAKVGEPAPDFTMGSTKDLDTLEVDVSLSDYKDKWLVLFFYPLDFTFVCPTEILAFSDRIADFEAVGAEVLGVSVDSKFSHKAWINTPLDENGIADLKYPLGADLTKQVSREYGVLIESEGIALRGLFIIDPDGVLQYQVVHALNVGRSVDETLRVLQALQAGGLCAANWTPGDDLLTPG
jgi:peroxiredoxin (alkyl hydroperoxide reductase subunit C)